MTAKLLELSLAMLKDIAKKIYLFTAALKRELLPNFVSKNSRKEGAGKLLLNKMEEYFKSIGCSFIQLDVMEDNTRAKKFYYSNGYEKRMLTLFKKIQ